MSIEGPAGPIAKRRKLSHSSSAETGTATAIDQRNNQGDQSEDDSKHAQQQARPKTNRPSSSKSGNVPLESMTKSSAIVLQINELLNEVTPDRDAESSELRPFVDSIVKAVKTVPEQSSLSLAQAEKVLRKLHVAIPFVGHRPKPDVQYKFAFQSPEIITIHGDVEQQRNVRDSGHIELAVQMPAGLFQEKDYLNHRAFHKRSFYLASIAAYLKTKTEFELSYDLKDGNALIPIILLNSNSGSKKHQKTNISINVTFPTTLGTIEKTLPSRNCVRSTSETDTSSPTSFYNGTLRSLASVPMSDTTIRKATAKCEAFTESCMLGQIWLQQHGFGSSVSDGGFGSDEWAQICALFLTSGGHRGQPLFSDRYSNIQLFKAMLQVFSGRDLVADPMIINANDVKNPDIDSPMLYDKNLGYNLLYKMSPWSYQMLKRQAQLSLTAVNARSQDNFDAVFIVKTAEPYLQFDEVYTIDGLSFIEGQSTKQAVIQNLYQILKRGLGDRVSLLSFHVRAAKAWDITKSDSKPSKSAGTIEICLLVDPDAASRLVDNGPSAEEQEDARDFREFWGEKSELRRFRDGRITETLVWSTDTPVTFQIIQYLALYHFKVLPSAIVAKSHSLEDTALLSTASISAAEAFKLINTKYQELSSKLHQMDGLALPIRAISPAGEALRSACTQHPLDPVTSEPIDLLIQFDSSARWPDHLAAIQHTKIAFLAKIGDLLSDSDPSLETRVGLENTESANTGYLNTSFLDIVVPSGGRNLSAIVFRLRIHHERELHLLHTQVALSKLLPASARDPITLALNVHKQTCLASPLHTTTLRNLITHFPPLSTTIRLLKSWASSHNLSNHIPSVALEIIASYIFLNPAPWSVPGSATTAFLRCLHFLSRWDWTISPLIIDLSLSQDMPLSARADLETRFQAWRRLDPAMNTVTWFVGTNIDNTGIVWTQGSHPPRVVATRVQALAKACTDIIKGDGSNRDGMNERDWSNLFVSPLGDFDFVIKLKKSIIPRSGTEKTDKEKRLSSSQFKNLQLGETETLGGTERIGHQPALLFLQELERCFGTSVLFCYGSETNERNIACLWRPGVLGRKEWRVRSGYSAIPVKGGKQDGEEGVMCVVNKEGILAEIGLLGDGMIEEIRTRK